MLSFYARLIGIVAAGTAVVAVGIWAVQQIRDGALDDVRDRSEETQDAAFEGVRDGVRCRQLGGVWHGTAGGGGRCVPLND